MKILGSVIELQFKASGHDWDVWWWEEVGATASEAISKMHDVKTANPDNKYRLIRRDEVLIGELE